MADPVISLAVVFLIVGGAGFAIIYYMKKLAGPGATLMDAFMDPLSKKKVFFFSAGIAIFAAVLLIVLFATRTIGF